MPGFAVESDESCSVLFQNGRRTNDDRGPPHALRVPRCSRPRRHVGRSTRPAGWSRSSINAQVASAPTGWTRRDEARGDPLRQRLRVLPVVALQPPGRGPPWPAACRAPERSGRRLFDGDGPRAEDGVLAPPPGLPVGYRPSTRRPTRLSGRISSFRRLDQARADCLRKDTQSRPPCLLLAAVRSGYCCHIVKLLDFGPNGGAARGRRFIRRLWCHFWLIRARRRWALRVRRHR